MNLSQLPTLALAILLAAPAALAQQDEPAARPAPADPLRMIIEAGKLKPRPTETEPGKAEPAKAEAAAKPSAAKPAADARSESKADAKPSPQTATLHAAPLPALAPLALESPAELAPARHEPRPQRSVDPDDYFGAPPPAAASRAAPVPAAAASRPAPAAASTGGKAAALRQDLEFVASVESVLPERLRQRMRSDAEVVLGFSVRARGLQGRTSSSARSIPPSMIEIIARSRTAGLG